jgi:hypothetical protein
LAASSTPLASPRLVRTLGGAGLLGFLLQLGNALFALNVGVQLVQLAHDRVMALLKLGGAGVVGVGLDLVQRRTGLGDKLCRACPASR